MCVSELRVHHGICTLFFEGKGYDDDFTQNMAEIVLQLKDSRSPLTLICKEDSICTACPNNKNGCITREKAERYDKRVIEICGLSEGETLTADRLYALVRRDIIQSDRLGEVCGDCRWYHICSQAAEKLRINR